MYRLSFGIKTAPAKFNRITDQILHDVLNTESYFDDIIIYGKTFPQNKELKSSSKTDAATKNSYKTISGNGHILFSISFKCDAVAYSRNLVKKCAEQNYSQLDRAALTIFYTVQHFHEYLYGRIFELDVHIGLQPRCKDMPHF